MSVKKLSESRDSFAGLSDWTSMQTILFATSLSTVPLVTFDGAPGTTFKFVELNDPVMGGQSTGTWNVTKGEFGTMKGEVVDVPSLSAPGFIKTCANGKFADASSAAGGMLVLTVRSRTPDYRGYRVSFASGTASGAYACSGGGSIPFSRGCFKSSFVVMPSTAYEFFDVEIPFANFTDLWSPATGEPTSTCKQDASACATAKVLASITRFELWAEGAKGAVDIDLMRVTAKPADARVSLLGLRSGYSARPPARYDTCSAAIQDGLKFGISGRTEPTLPFVDMDETLAEQVCCDVRALPYAEPQFLYDAPDIALFDKLPTDSSPTTFYDSVCGLPLFTAPRGRTFADFQADTAEHGWPSFRPEELIAANVITNETTGFVTSKCGTHLGSYLPDEKGARWCIDLSCIAGHAAA